MDALFFGDADTFEQPCQMVPQIAHRLHTLQIFANLIGRLTVYHVPIRRTDHGHLGIGKILMQYIERCCRACAACADNRSTGFLHKIPFARVKHSIQHRQDLAGGMCIIHGGAENKAVCHLCMCQTLIDNIIIKHTMSQLFTPAACNAIMYTLSTHLENFCLHTVLIQSLCNFAQCRVCASIFSRAAVEQQHMQGALIKRRFRSTSIGRNRRIFPSCQNRKTNGIYRYARANTAAQSSSVISQGFAKNKPPCILRAPRASVINSSGTMP